MKIGLVSCAAEASGQEEEEGVIRLQRHRGLHVINMGTGETIDNVSAFLWGKGKAINGRFPEFVFGDNEDVIRSWPTAEEGGKTLFDQQLDPEQDYLLLAVPCTTMRNVQVEDLHLSGREDSE